MTLPALEDECFYIAPIGLDGSPERKRSDGVLNFIVKPAAQALGLTAVRADGVSAPGQITLQVVDHVLKAKASVVDLTGLNPNVFYELAIRHAAKLPVALIADEGTRLPFDIAQMRTIFFDPRELESADKCRQEIVTHLREALERGAVDSPIATVLDMKVMEAGGAAERSIAELISTVEEMVSLQRLSAMGLETLSRRFDVLMMSPTAHPRGGVGVQIRAAVAELTAVYERLMLMVEVEPLHPYYPQLVYELGGLLSVITEDDAFEIMARQLVRGNVAKPSLPPQRPTRDAHHHPQRGQAGGGPNGSTLRPPDENQK